MLQVSLIAYKTLLLITKQNLTLVLANIYIRCLKTEKDLQLSSIENDWVPLLQLVDQITCLWLGLLQSYCKQVLDNVLDYEHDHI